MTDQNQGDTPEKTDLYSGIEVDLPGSYTPELEAVNDTDTNVDAEEVAKDGLEPTEDVEGEGDGEQSEPRKEKPKGKKTAAERIAEITKEKHEARREAAEKDAEIARLKALISPPTEVQASKEPSPEDYEHGEFDPRYISDLVDYKTDQRVSAEVKRYTEQQAQAAQMADAQSRHAKFVEACQADEDVGVSAFQLTQDTSAPVTKEMADVILHSDNGVRIAAYLNDNREELSRISALPAHMQAYELAKIERSTQPAKAEAATRPAITKAPDPTHAGSGRKVSATKEPSKMTQAEYEAWAAKQQAALRKPGW